jgi:hypothetical protein
MDDHHSLLVRTISCAEEERLSCDDLRDLLLEEDNLTYFFENRRLIKHALGFLQIQLGEFDGRAVRLHMWPGHNDHATDKRTDIHSHPWRLQSYVLFGSIGNSVFQVFESNCGPGQIYEVERQGGAVTHRKLDIKVAWKPLSVETIGRDGHYSVEASAFHSSTFTAIGAVTLVIAGERGGSLARVVRIAPAPRVVTRLPVYLSVSQKKKALSTVYSYLGKTTQRSR